VKAKDLYVKITKATPPAWYVGKVGEVFHVKAKTTLHFGGQGYRCLDVCGGILVSDCEIVEAPK
jgi:hypothetical protein